MFSPANNHYRQYYETSKHHAAALDKIAGYVVTTNCVLTVSSNQRYLNHLLNLKVYPCVYPSLGVFNTH